VDFYALLDDLTDSDRSALFKEPNAVRTLFRLLSPPAQQAAIRLLYGRELSVRELGRSDSLHDLQVSLFCLECDVDLIFSGCVC
jgi:hypothetical protein